MAMVVGSASAFFLWALDVVTVLRFGNPWLLYLLPVAGLVMGILYQRYEKNSAEGEVPRRAAPMILFSTLLTHLCGGSAGREGTALQMGGGIAAVFTRFFKTDLALLVMAGMAAGFGSVFGTPIAGAVFALEVARKRQYRALIPCFIAAVVADWTCEAWGIHHVHYHVGGGGLGLSLLGKVMIAAMLCGFVGRLYVVCSHRMTQQFQRWIPRPQWRPVVGGVMIIGMTFLVGIDYLGLGILGNGKVTLPAMFYSLEIPPWAWGLKLMFTVVTLSAGFKGGEVTPLFFIGAALGNMLAVAMGAPVDLMAAIGFVALFAAASKTPTACTLLGMEIFGMGIGVYLAAACFVAYACSGRVGIYSGQRLTCDLQRG